MSFWKSRQQIGLAAVIMALSIFVSRFMGLIRDKLISYLFGATRESDLYFAAFVIPDFINYLLAGGYFSITLIPLLAHYFERDEESGWKFFSTVFGWIAISISLLTAIAMIFAPELAHIAAPGIGGEDRARLAHFLRIILPAQIFFLLGSCFTAILYLRKQFSVPALTPLVYNLFIIIGGALLYKRGMEGFCWGVLVGSLIGNFLLPWFAARSGGGLKMSLSFRHPGLRGFVVMALPLMIGKSIVVLDEQLVRVFGSLAAVGAISWLNYARRIMLVPVGVVAQAAGVASYPFLAELHAKGDLPRFNETLNSALRNVLVILVPLSIWMMIVAEPTIRLIFQQGRFGVEDTRQTALLLQVLLVVVFCWGYQQILGRGFYAMQDTLTPAVIGTAVSLLSIPLFYLLTVRFGAIGVAVASAASIAAYTATLALWWKHRFGGGVFSGHARNMVTLALLSVPGAVPSILILRSSLLSFEGHPYLGAFLGIGLTGALFGLIFAVLCRRIAPDLLRPFLSRLGPVGRIFG